jgi:hypothetical protein
MPKITFSITADYDAVPVEPMYIQPTVEYSIEIPKNTELTLSDLDAHYHNWLRALGYVIND